MGAVPNSFLYVSLKARMLNYYKSETNGDQQVFFEVALYEDERWDYLTSLGEEANCRRAKEMAA
jgi:hypothetical protein